MRAPPWQSQPDFMNATGRRGSGEGRRGSGQRTPGSQHVDQVWGLSNQEVTELENGGGEQFWEAGGECSQGHTGPKGWGHAPSRGLNKFLCSPPLWNGISSSA